MGNYCGFLILLKLRFKTRLQKDRQYKQEEFGVHGLIKSAVKKDML